ncbi:MAG: Rhs element Vgr protein [Colwellia sp.]
MNSAANKIPSAQLVYQDGSADKGKFPLSEQDLFIPGNDIEISAGNVNETTVIFSGIVVKHTIKIKQNKGSTLVVECKNKVCRLAANRTSHYFYEQSDSEIIEQLLTNAEVDNLDVAQSSIIHPEIVQYNATDWDFCLLRAQVSGQLIILNADKVEVKPAKISTNVICELEFGATIIEADLSIDGRNQYKGIKSYSWNQAKQEVFEKEAIDPEFTSPGNLDVSTTLNLSFLQQKHPTISESEAQQWADSSWLYSQINRVSGVIKCQGMSAVKTGDTVELVGLGNRFNGNAFVTGVRHDFGASQAWQTSLQFGGIEWLNVTQKVVDQPNAAGLIPGVNGLQVGIVVSNEDPDDECRVQVRMPLISDAEDGTWARLATLDAGNDRGFYFYPEVGDEVIIGFLANDPRQAVILGMLHSSANLAPIKPNDNNNEKGYVSRANMKMTFDDENIDMTFSTPAGNSIRLTEIEGGIVIEDQNGSVIKFLDSDITIESAGNLTLKAAQDINIESGGNTEISASIEAKISGASGCALDSSGITEVKGALVKIN